MKAEKVFEISGEGGGICINREKDALGETFIYTHNEFDPSDEGLDVNEKEVYNSFEAAFQRIHSKYSWCFLFINAVHRLRV